MKLYIKIFLLLCSVNLFAQNSYSLLQFKNETVDFFKQPSQWNNNDLIKLGIIGTTTFLLIQTDQSLRNEIMKDRSYYKSFPIELGRKYGELYSPLIFTGLFGLNGLINKDQQSKKIAFEIIQTTFYSGLITSGLKIAFGRARPFTEKGSKDFGNLFLLDDEFHSLPSGHTTIAFSISSVLANNTESNWLKVLCYVPAFLTATSRVYQDKHWLSDVFLGGIIGFTVGNWVTSKHNNLEVKGFSSSNRIYFSILF
ncbi:MAG: phosphatase PAP2 family protein [Melioribacteraceae bacterium]|nr:phosphatase PAP2 family protein [Melioribacteraceae bacterium]